MASAFESDFFGEGAWSVLASQHGETCTVTPQTGGVGPFTGIKTVFRRGRLENPRDGEEDGRARPQHGVMWFSPADVPNWTPIRGDAIAIGSDNYAVVSLGNSAPILKVEVITKDA